MSLLFVRATIEFCDEVLFALYLCVALYGRDEVLVTLSGERDGALVRTYS